MKYPYSFRRLDNTLIMEFDEYHTPITYVLLDIDSLGGDPSIWLKAIEDVVSGKKSKAEINSNVSSVEIGKEYSHVIDFMEPNGEVSECTIETEELREIIKIWKDKNDELNK